MSVFSFVGGRFPLAATASRSPLPPLAYCGADKCINRGIESFREFRDFGGRKSSNHERQEKHEMGLNVITATEGRRESHGHRNSVSHGLRGLGVSPRKLVDIKQANRKLLQAVAVLHWGQILSKPVEFDGLKNPWLHTHSCEVPPSPLSQQRYALMCQIRTSKLQGSRSQFVILKKAFIDYDRTRLVTICDRFLLKNVRAFGGMEGINHGLHGWHGLGIVREFPDFGGKKGINHERHEKHEMGMGVV